MEIDCWVNVYHGLYAHCSDGMPYYISLGYPSQELAIKALNSPKAKGIRNRYITTTNMKTINEHVQLFNTLEGAISYFTRTCISGGKSGRLLTLTKPTGQLDFVVDITPKLNEQVHMVHPDKYVIIKTTERYPSRVTTVNTCMTCKHWNNTGAVNGVSDCWHIGSDDKKSFMKPGAKDGAFIDIHADDDQGLNVAFMTRATFSCGDHEPEN